MADENKNEISKALEAISNTKNHKMVFAMGPGMEETLTKAGYSKNPNSELQYMIDQAQGTAKKGVGLAFTEPISPGDSVLGLYKSKRALIPDSILKQIRITDHLVAAIVRARGAMMSLFGHLRKDRFDLGIEVAIKPDFFKILTPEQYEKIVSRMKKFEQLLLNCGHTEGVENQDRMTIAEFLEIQTSNLVTFSRCATEIIYDRSMPADSAGNYPFFRFRPVDVGTIVRAVRKGELVGNTLRMTAIKALESIKGEKVDISMDKLKEDNFAWLQVVEGTPRQAFTHDEMLVFNLHPSTDLEHNGYPVSPIDTVINSITTHISIDVYKKLYFQNGRASKGMLVIQSDEVDQQTLDNLRLQFAASLNSVNNSFRTPVFGIGKEDKIDWLPMNGEGGNDNDFEYMYDQIARNILSAFSMSPDELPGYGHLSRGTNSQTLSESNSEYKMTAARDTGLRPIILKWQNFLNERLFPIIDPLLAKICEVRLVGLDAQSKEQETARLNQDMAIHMSYDEVLKAVDKDPIGVAFGGAFPFSERMQLILDKYMDVSQIVGQFFNRPAAFVDPMLRYKRDPFAIQAAQLLAEANPNSVKAMFMPRPFAIDLLKMNIQDMLEEE